MLMWTRVCRVWVEEMEVTRVRGRMQHTLHSAESSYNTAAAHVWTLWGIS